MSADYNIILIFYRRFCGYLHHRESFAEGLVGSVAATFDAAVVEGFVEFAVRFAEGFAEGFAECFVEGFR